MRSIAASPLLKTALVSLIVSMSASSAFAATLKHHDFAEGDSVVVDNQPDLRPSEVYSVRFTAPTYPVQITAVRFFLGENGEKAQWGQCGTFSLRIYDDVGTVEPGAVLLDTWGQDKVFELTETNGLIEITLSASGIPPVTVNGPFRVGLVGEDVSCPITYGFIQDPQTKGFGSLYTDEVMTEGVNFMWRRNCTTQIECNELNAAGGEVYSWHELSALFPLAGDFVMEVDVPGDLTFCSSDDDCADSNPCTVGSCEGGGCSFEALDGQDCDDGNPCTVSSTCSGQTCVAGELVDCDDGDQCTFDSCDIGGGQCVHTWLGGSGCDEPDPDPEPDAGPSPDARQDTAADPGGVPDVPTPTPDVGPDLPGSDDATARPDVDSGALTLSSVSPFWVPSDQSTLLTVEGAGFRDGLTVRVGPATLTELAVASDSRAIGTLPVGLSPGFYTVYATLLGQEATLADGLEVRGPAAASGSEEGCAGAPASRPLWVAMAFLALALARRRQPA